MRIAVVGAGIVGRLLTWRLLLQGCKVTLFDLGNAHSQHNCSSIAAGMLSPLAELDRADPLIYELGMASIFLWQSWLSELTEPVGFRKSGSLLIAHPQDVREFTRYLAIINSKLSESSKDIQMLDSVQLNQLEPDILNSCLAAYLPNEAHIVSQEVLAALFLEFQHYPVEWRLNEEVKQIKPYQVDAERFDWVFDCRGLAAKQDLPGLRGVRGELLKLHCPEINITRPVRILHPRYKVYLVPRSDHHYLVGATEIETEDFSPISVRSNLELLNTAYMVNPGFAEARIIASYTHCRPAFDDNKPKLFTKLGLTAINGLFRHGYLLAPILIKNVVDTVLNQQPSELSLWQEYP